MRKKTVIEPGNFFDLFLKENYSNYFNKKEIIATCKIITAFKEEMNTDDYNKLYESELSIFTPKKRKFLELYLTLYLAPEEEDYNHLYLTSEQVTEIYGR